MIPHMIRAAFAIIAFCRADVLSDVLNVHGGDMYIPWYRDGAVGSHNPLWTLVQVAAG
jgi:hypothetical protein